MKRLLLRIGAAILLLVLAILVYGVVVEPYQIDLEEEVAVIPGLPAEWEGKQVAVIGDFQVGMWLGNTRTIKRISERLSELQPEAVLILGDFIYHPAKSPENETQIVIEQLLPLLQAGIPVYAVLGNHDYAMGYDNDVADKQTALSLESALERAGITVLRNQAVLLYTNGGTGQHSSGELYLVGIDANYPDQDDPEQALAHVPQAAPRLVMMHHPATFVKLPPGSAPLAVAGHTHGGQVRIPFTPEWSWMTYTQADEVHADGWIEGYGAAGNRLYINRGVGFSVAPIRINCPPEITLFRLQSR